MIIAQVITSLDTGGAEKLVVDISKILDKYKDIKVKIISISGNRGIPFKELKENYNSIELIELNYKNLKNPKIAFDLYKVTKNCDLVHAHTFYAQLYCSVLISKKKLITTEHSTNNNRRNKSIFKIVDYLMYRKYKDIICISDDTKIQLNNWIKSTTLKSRVINNGINIHKYNKAKPIKREVLGFDNDDILLICVARFSSQKNHINLVKAIKYVDDKVKLILVGDGELRDKIKKEVQKYNLYNKVYFMGIRRDIENLLKMSDIFILPSIWEGFGLGAVEAAASGIPIILSDVDGLNKVFEREMVTFINPGDVKSIVNGINECVKNLNNNYKNSIEMKYLEKYSLDKVVKEYVNLYRNSYGN